MVWQKLTTKIQQRHTLISSQLCPGPEDVRVRKVKMLVVQSCLTLSGPHGLQPVRLLQSMEFSRQEYWSGLPFPFPGDLWDPGIKPRSSALQADLLHHCLSQQAPGDEGFPEIRTLVLQNFSPHPLGKKLGSSHPCPVIYLQCKLSGCLNVVAIALSLSC